MDLSVLNQFVLTYALVFTRIAGMMLTAPLFDSKHFPVRVKVLLIFMITLTLAPPIYNATNLSFVEQYYPILMLQECVTGVLVGFIFKLVFEIFMVAGQLIAMQAGLGFALLSDPQNGIQVPVISEIYFVAILFIFLITNSHLMLIHTLSSTYNSLPIDSWFFYTLDLNTVFEFSKNIFSGSVLLILPALITLLLVNFTLAVMTRAAPQLNIFTIGFPIMLISGLTMLYVTFQEVTVTGQHELKQGFDLIERLVT